MIEASKELAGQVALVTGGSRGIGRAICLSLAKRGATIIVNYNSNEQAANETAEQCLCAGAGAVKPLRFNISEVAEVDAAIEGIKKDFDRLDILVNNAGIARDNLMIRLKTEDWSDTIRTNLDGVFYCSRAAVKIMMRARAGRIVNISSVVGEMGNAGQVPYSASKAGVIGMTKSMARELGSRGVLVNAVTPGFIETEMTAALNEQQRAYYLANIPLERFARSEEVSELVAFLCSPAASYITGQVIGVNGGMYM